MEGALSGAILTEKPNVSWDDVSGLEVAKENLKKQLLCLFNFLNYSKG